MNQSAGTGGDGNGLENNPANSLTDNGTFAVDTNSGTNTNTSCDNVGKDSHLFYDYDLSGVPAGATIQGLEVRLDGKVDATGGVPKFCVQLSWDGGTSWTSYKNTTNLTKTEATYLLGGMTDTWGRIWNNSDLMSGNFRVRVVMVSSNTGRDFSLDWVAVKLFYTNSGTPMPTNTPGPATATPTPTPTGPTATPLPPSPTPTPTNTPAGPTPTATRSR